MTSQPPRLLDRVRAVLRRKQYSLRTEEASVSWIKRFVLFHDKRHPQELGLPEVEVFLTDLTMRQQVAAATQNQALSALLFLYSAVLQPPLSGHAQAVRAKQPTRLPTVLSRAEVGQVVAALQGTHQVMSKLLYGSGLRVMECVRLRVKDRDLPRHQITVHAGKGDKDWVTMLPRTICGTFAVVQTPSSV